MPNIEILLHDPDVWRDCSGFVTRWLLRVQADRQCVSEHHHSKVAEHLELAAKSHKEVAKLIGANDHAAAQTHAKVAGEHFAKAQEHMELAKKGMPASK